MPHLGRTSRVCLGFVFGSVPRANTELNNREGKNYEEIKILKLLLLL